MKSEMVKLEHRGLKFKMSRPRLAEIALASVFASQTLPANAPATSNVPLLGDIWPGQGGVNGGFVAERGMYAPPTAGQRANVIADRIEAYNSAPIWQREPQAEMAL